MLFDAPTSALNTPSSASSSSYSEETQISSVGDVVLSSSSAGSPLGTDFTSEVYGKFEYDPDDVFSISASDSGASLESVVGSPPHTPFPVPLAESLLVNYIELLSDSEPDPTHPPRGRTPPDYWTQHTTKLSFIQHALITVAHPTSAHLIHASLQTALSSAHSPSRGPFARYYMHNGDVFASYEDGPWTQVVDVTGLVVHRHNAKYEKSSNRSWVREHDAWMDALALAPEELLGPLESKSQWLESRVFSLDREIARVKWEVERREEALRWREGVDVFGFPRRGRRGGRRWEGDGCGR